MKKIISLILTLALAVAILGGISISAFADYTLKDDIERTYKNAMETVNSSAYKRTFTDPHEAWNDFITTKESNNWFQTRGKETKSTEVPDYYCYPPEKFGYDRFNGNPPFDEYFDLCRQLRSPPTNTGIWSWNSDFDKWATDVYYSDATYTAKLGHPTYLCNLDNPIAWNSSAKYTFADTMYTGEYSADMKAKIQTWWDTLDAYVATQNGTTSTQQPSQTQAPAQTTTPTTGGTTTQAPTTTDTSTGTTFTIGEYEINVSDWALKDVTAAIEAGIYTFDGNYWLRDLTIAKMNENAYRSYFCTFIAGLFRSLGKGDMLQNPYADAQTPFEDIGYAYTGWETEKTRFPGLSDALCLYNLGIINGVSATEFDYFGNLTREQAATIIQRTATVLGINLPDGDIPFTDSISDWALDGVRHCYAAGLMNGYDDTTFGAKDNYTYEQALITVYRLYQYAVANG